MRKNVVVAVAGLLCLSMSMAFGQTVSKIKGVVFADYYHLMSHHDSDMEGQNAFNLRRVYFTFENSLTEKIKMRFRMESAHDKYGSTDKIRPFVKHAYLAWNDLIPLHTLYLGIAETSALKNAETYWGYRSIEKTIMDLNKIGSSADMGVALKGDLSPLLHHWLTFTNGTGYGSAEVDNYKKIGYSVWITPVKGLMIEGYADYEKQDPKTGTFQYAHDYFHASSYHTIKGFVGYKVSGFSVGAEYFARTNRESGASDALGTAKKDVVRSGYSLFGSWQTPLPKLKVFGRYDFFDPNTGDHVFTSATKNGLDDEYTLLIAGLDFISQGDIHFLPNIMIKNYSKSGMDADVTARMTLYFKFDTGKIII